MKFEFLPAFKGDCFLIHAGTAADPFLILIDGGPGGTYKGHLRPRLMALRDDRGLGPHEPLIIDLVIVSHVDDDHINVGALWRWRFERADANSAPGVECYLGQGWNFDSDTYPRMTPARYQRLVAELKRVG